MGALDFFYWFKGEGGFEKHCTRASLHSDCSGRSDKNQCRGSSLEDVDARERVWPAGLAEAKDQEGQTTGVGHPRGM